MGYNFNPYRIEQYLQSTKLSTYIVSLLSNLIVWFNISKVQDLSTYIVPLYLVGKDHLWKGF